VYRKGEKVRLAPGQIGGGIAPGLGISEERLLNRVGREVIIVFDNNGLARLCDGLSVDCDFDHFHVWFAVLWVDGAERKGEIRNLRGRPTRFFMRSIVSAGAPHGSTDRNAPPPSKTDDR